MKLGAPYLCTRRIADADYILLTALCRNPKPIGKAALAIHAPADVENGPSHDDIEDEMEAGEMAERLRAYLALALVAREDVLNSADLYLLRAVLEDAAAPQRLLATVDTLYHEALRREDDSCSKCSSPSVSEFGHGAYCK